jgi:protein-disulfide isomerase
MSQKTIRTIMLIIILLALGGSFAWYFKHQQQSGHSSGPLKVVKIDTKNQPMLGNPNAKNHIVVFEDLKCVACMMYNTQVYPQLKKQYIDTGKANYTIINLAFLPNSATAATAARCLYKQKPAYFFKFVAYTYHHQGAENDNWTTIPTMQHYASTIKGVNMGKLSQCLIANPYQDFLNNNIKQARKIMGSTVITPSIYINGVFVTPLDMKNINRVFNATAKD